MAKFLKTKLIIVLIIIISSLALSCNKVELTAQDYYMMGLNYQQGQKAIDAYTKAIELDNNYVEALNNRGSVYRTLGDYDKAITDHQQAIQLKPEDPYLYANLAMDYAAKGDSELALDAYDNVLRLSPNMAEAYVNRSMIYIENEQFDLAIQDCTRAIEIENDMNLRTNLNLFPAYMNRANAYYAKQQYQLAVDDLTAAILIELYSAEAYFARGECYKNLGEVNEARADFKKAIAYSNDPQLTQAAKDELAGLD